MSERPLDDRWARFTPDVTGLDRDAILFAAGRNAARASRLWPALAVLLAASQVLTLVALWPRPAAPIETAPVAAPPVDLSLPPASPPSDVWSIRSRPEVVQDEWTNKGGDYVSTGPPLTAASGLRFN